MVSSRSNMVMPAEFTQILILSVSSAVLVALKWVLNVLAVAVVVSLPRATVVDVNTRPSKPVRPRPAWS